ncbi:recombinase, serine integrase type [Streptomyces phage Pablito]|uniref:Recombinase, serine integrase type n=1 Tax=Streptomyces phage Pablito TaxID=2894593 RepID=A0AAE9C7E2_9CAUD|nr:recombinase, serine integrase type [Streptomyces phage Pablito]UFD97990.1 recombinase, serine integrase type [Streptomyces phage Pablito]
MGMYPKAVLLETVSQLGGTLFAVMNRGGPTVRASIYVRISQDVTGEELGVQRQEEQCRELCKQLGMEVREVWVDNDLSATKKSVVRPDFEAMLGSQPEAIVCWHTDRLIRVTRDLERVIDLGVNVHAVMAGHLDLSTPAGRAVARTVTAWATYEGEQKAERQKLANVQAARAGKPYTAGTRPFGYADDHMTIVEEEAAAIRDGARMVLAGESLSAVARKWTEAGLRSARAYGKDWTLRGVKKVLTSPRYVGHSTYHGEVMGKGQWPAILDEDTFYGAVAILNNPERFSGGKRTGRTPGTLLAGIALCGECGEAVNGRGYRGVLVYGCKATHTRTPRSIADDRARTATLARLVFPDFLGQILSSGQAQDGQSAASLHSEAQTLRERLDGLATAYAEGAISLSQMTAGSSALQKKLEAVESELVGSAGIPPFDPVAGVAGLIQGWPDTPLPTRRAWVDFCLVVTLNPARGRHMRNMSTDDHVTVEWRDVAE